MQKITLEAARVNTGLKQWQLAEKMGVSRTTINKWENGKAPMKPVYLYMFCGITGFSEDELILPIKST